MEKQTIERQETPNPIFEELKEVTTVDTVHRDEALKVLAQYAGDRAWTAEEEKTLTRKIDRKLIPLLCITYGLQYYDKAMLSQAVSKPPSTTSMSFWQTNSLSFGMRYG